MYWSAGRLRQCAAESTPVLMFCVVLESVKLVSALMKTLMSQGMQNGLLSTQLQLLLDKAQLMTVITCLAALRKQHLLATTAIQQLSHNMAPFEEQRLIHSLESKSLSKRYMARRITLVSQLAAVCTLAAPQQRCTAADLCYLLLHALQPACK